MRSWVYGNWMREQMHTFKQSIQVLVKENLVDAKCIMESGERVRTRIDRLNILNKANLALRRLVIPGTIDHLIPH